MRTWIHTGFALVAFAANSVLCRLALGSGAIDAAGFTSVRLASGAATLLLLPLFLGEPRRFRPRGSWGSAAALFAYAAAFSFAYLRLSAGTGALILFGAVQVTMLTAAVRAGERLGSAQWSGLALALAGLVVLVLPGLRAPSPLGSALMAAAGAAWGVYTLRGRRSTDPRADTAGNFLRAVPLVLVVNLAALPRAHLSPAGLLWAVLSGAVASGLGYAVWYSALAGLTATRASLVQLTVPVLAAAGGVALLAETVSPRLVGASVLILGGVALAVVSRRRPAPSEAPA